MQTLPSDAQNPGPDATAPAAGRRGAVLAVSVAAGFLVAGEFLPVSLLPPIARDFAISEGRAGQSIAISGIFAVLTSLAIVPLTARIDRRLVVASFVGIMALSGLIAGLASGFGLFLVARALVGIAVGGFWSFSTATIVRLVPVERVAVSLAFLGSGIALAGTIAAPAASLLGEVLGWRGTMLLVAPLGMAIGLWLWWSLPPMPPRGLAQRRNAFRPLRQRQVRLAMTATALVFMGQFAVFTYVRPFLEGVAGIPVGAVPGVLLALGLAGVAGTWAVGRVLRRRLFAPLTVLPLIMALIGAGLWTFGANPIAAAVLFCLWGLVATAAPVGWGLWLSRALPDDTESGGGLQVAVIQTAIATGAWLGGWALDFGGWTWVIWLGITCLVGSSAYAALAARDFRNR